MRKKFTLLLASLLCCVGVVKAAVTDLPQLSTDGDIKWYTIKNVRGNAFARYDGDGEAIKLTPTVESNAYLFYFTEGTTAGTYKIHNSANELLCAAPNSWTEEGLDWYIAVSGCESHPGLAISKESTLTIDGSEAWNDYQNSHKSVAWYGGDDAGSTWEIAPYESAAPTIQFSTEDNIVLHYIRSNRRDSYVNFDGHNSTFKEGNLGAGSYWYFVQDAEAQKNAPKGFIACRIFNAAHATGVENYTSGFMGTDQWPASVFYIGLRENDNYGYVIYKVGENVTNGWHDFGGTHVGTYGVGDNGSLWRIYPSGKTAADLIADAKTATESTASLMPVAKEAYYYSYPDAAIAAVEAAVANFSEENLTAAMSSHLAIEKALKEKRTAAPAVGDLIILKNKSNGNFLTDDGESAKVNTKEKEENAVWEVVVGENGVKLKNYKTGRYLGTIKQSEATSTIAEGDEGIAEFEWNNQKDVYAVFKPVGGGYYQYGHFSGGNLVGWEPGADATQWIATKVCSLTISYRYNGKTLDTTSEYAKVGTYTVSSPYDFTKPTTCKKGEESLEAVDGVFSFELTESTELTVELGDNLPFVAAADYASINNWYYIQMHSNTKRYIQAKDDYIEWVDAEVNANEIDSYTWAFIGNPIDGFKLVNRSTGDAMSVNSNGSGNPAMGAFANATTWMIKSSRSNPTIEYFCFKYPNGEYMNAQNGKVAFWWDNDNGSTMCVTERDLSGAEELQALIDQVEAFVAAGVNAGNTVGYITTESVDNVAAALAAAKEAVAAKTGCIEAQVVLQNAVAAVETIQPEEGKFYTLKNNNTGRYMNVNANAGLIATTAVGLGEVFQFVKDNGSLYLKNVERGTYLNTAVQHGWGQNSAAATSIADAKAIVVENLGKGNQVSITPNGGATLHHDTNNNNVVAWDGSADSKSSWSIEAVDITELSHVVSISDIKWATLVLGYNAIIPEGVTAYVVTEVGDGVAKLSEITSNIPANEAVLLNAEAGSYNFKYANSAEAVDDNLLAGSTVNMNVEGLGYVLFAKEGNVGLYKAKFNVSTDNTNDGTENEPAVTYEAFLNNAFKAYLPAPAGASAPMFSFGRGEGTTSIEGVQLTNDNVVIYDLTGRRVEKMEKGIYIVNGKKVVIK